MNKWLILIACLIVFAGCKKTDNVAANVNKQAAIDDQRITAFIAANNLSATHVGTPKVDSIGVWYVVENAGTTAVQYTSSTTITVGYTAKYILADGTEKTFTTSSNESNVNPAFILGQTIKGWQLGIQAAKVNKGGKLRILMASRYAYGPYEQTQYGLPANSVLDFEITIFDVTN